jgi:hypothetical protein
VFELGHQNPPLPPSAEASCASSRDVRGQFTRQQREWAKFHEESETFQEFRMPGRGLHVTAYRVASGRAPSD